MKKLLAFILLALCGILAGTKTADAQLYGVAMTKTALSDSAIINTGTPVVSTTVLESRAVVSVQVVVTKNSGTVAGKCECMGSLDGTNYVRIKGAASPDTVVLTNVTSQNYIWTVTPSKYLSYRIRCTGVGTMNARMSGILLRRKAD